MSSSSGSSSSDSESSSGSDDETSSSEGDEAAHPSPSQQYNNRNVVANGTSRPQGSNQLMNTLSKSGFQTAQGHASICETSVVFKNEKLFGRRK